MLVMLVVVDEIMVLVAVTLVDVSVPVVVDDVVVVIVTLVDV